PHFENLQTAGAQSGEVQVAVGGGSGEVTQVRFRDASPAQPGIVEFDYPGRTPESEVHDLALNCNFAVRQRRRAGRLRQGQFPIRYAYRQDARPLSAKYPERAAVRRVSLNLEIAEFRNVKQASGCLLPQQRAAAARIETIERHAFFDSERP